MQNYMLAYFLLFGPTLSDREYEVLYYANIKEELRELAVSHECLDPANKTYYFAWPQVFVQDIKTMRQTIDELKDAPPASDRCIFAHLNDKYILECMDFNRKFCEQLKSQQNMHWKKEGFDEAIQETDRITQIYLHLWRITHHDTLFPDIRRSLKELKKEIGAENYYSGRIPPPVPVWRFREIP